MVPTRLGGSLIVVAGTCYTLAWLTRVGWLYIPVSLVLAILTLNLLLPPINIQSLQARRRPKSRHSGKLAEIFEGDTLTVELHLSSRSLLPKIVITLQESCPCAAPGKEERGYLIGVLPRRGSAVVSYEVRCDRRGLYSFPPLGVQSSAPFGLFRARGSIEAPLQVTVYPEVLPMNTAPTQGAFSGDSARFPQPGFSGELRGSREFQQFDDLRHIHWRNSARSGQLIVKEFDQTPRGEVRMALNPGVNLGRGKDTTLEYAVKIAASLAHFSFSGGRRFLMWPGPTKAGLTTWHDVLEHLSRIRAAPQPSVGELLSYKGAQGISVVAVSAADNDTLGQLRQLQSPRGNIVVVMMEGFDSREDPGARDKLSKLGLTVVACEVNELGKTLDELGQILEKRGAAATS